MLLEKQRQIKIKSGLYAYENTDSEISLKDKFNAKANYKENNYKIRVRIKGDRPQHWISPFETSLRIDLSGEKRILGMEEFSIHKPIHRNYTHELAFHK